jgi:hypothetical protein
MRSAVFQPELVTVGQRLGKTMLPNFFHLIDFTEEVVEVLGIQDSVVAGHSAAERDDADGCADERLEKGSGADGDLGAAALADAGDAATAATGVAVLNELVSNGSGGGEVEDRSVALIDRDGDLQGVAKVEQEFGSVKEKELPQAGRTALQPLKRDALA